MIAAYKADFVITMDKENKVIDNGGLVVDGENIIFVGSLDDIKSRFPETPMHEYNNCIIMPGLINAHSHSGLLRGTAEYLKLWDWLRKYIDPMHKVLLPHEAEIASYLCYGEQLLSGTTTVVDMWRYMEGSAKASLEIGNRVIMVPYVGDRPGYDYFDTLEDNEKLIKAWHQTKSGRISVWVGIEHFLYGTKKSYKKIRDICQNYDTGFHTHSNESKDDVDYLKNINGIFPIESLHKNGLLNINNVLLAHCVWLDIKEIKLLSDFNIGVAHNPISNMKLSSGAANIHKLIDSGIAVGIGTDGEKENNNMDLFDSMKVASLLSKHSSSRPDILDHWDLLRSVTIEGARSIGLDNRIGSLEVNKLADFIIINSATPRLTPFITSGDNFNIHHNLVHSVRGGDVTTVVVNGKVVVNNGNILCVDYNELINKANLCASELIERRDIFVKSNLNVISTPIEKL